jgi:uncharacterized protein with LGFP repeats
MNAPHMVSGIQHSVFLRNPGDKEIVRGLDEALGHSIAPVINYGFAGGVAQNPDGSRPGQITNCHYHAEWDAVANVLEFGQEGSCIRIPAKERLSFMPVFGVEMKVWPRRKAADGKRMNLLEGQATPFALMIRRTDQLGEYRLSASVNLEIGWRSIEVPATRGSNADGWYEKRHYLVARGFQPERWSTVAMVYTGSDLFLFINGTVLARRIFRQTIRPIQVSPGDYFVGTWVDGRSHPFDGMIDAVRIWDAIPYQYLPKIEAVEHEGWWEIPSRRAELGGGQGFLGSPSEPNERKYLLHGVWFREREYQGGSLYWSPKTGTHEVHGAIRECYEFGNWDLLGLPRTDELDGATSGARYNLFENGAIYWSPRTGACEMAGQMYAKYQSLGGEKGFLGLPKVYKESPADRYNKVYEKGYEICELEHGELYYGEELGAAYEVHGAILSRYRERFLKERLGLPTSDESPVLDDQSRPTGARVSTFQHGAIYWSPATGAVAVFGRLYQEYTDAGGPSSELGLPIRDSHYHHKDHPGSDHQDFENGVIIIHKSSNGERVWIIPELVFVLQESVSGEIDDGCDPFPPIRDRTPELYAKVQVVVEGFDPDTTETIATRVLDGGTRFPTGDHASDRLVFERHYSVKPVRYHMCIHLHVDFWDHDSWSKKDYLGTLDHTIANHAAWGMASDYHGKYAASLTHINTDHTPNKATIQTYFGVDQPAHIDPNRPFREQCFWPFDNFKTDPLHYQIYANTFKDVELEGWFRRPIDHLLYELVFKHVAAKGNCFGMCLEAMYALASRSMYTCPLSKYKALGNATEIETDADLSGILARQINSKQCYQWSSSSVSWFLNRLGTMDAIRPLATYERIKQQLDHYGTPIIVSMIDIGSSRGHAVLAYAWSEWVEANNSMRRLLIADPNFPYCNAYLNSELSYIQVFDDNTFQHSGYYYPGYHDSDYHSERLLGPLLPGTLMLDIPYRVLAAEPETPAWLIYLGLTALLGGLILIAVDAECRQVSTGGEGQLYRYHNGERRIVANGIPGMARIPAFDAQGDFELYSQRGDLPEHLTFELVGRKNGHYDQVLEAPRGSCRIRVPVEAGNVDTLEYEGADSGPPNLTIKTTVAAKHARISYIIYGEPQEKTRTTFDLTLGLSRDMQAAIGFDRRAQALMVAPAGAPATLKVHIKTERGGETTKSSMILHPTRPGESFKIYPFEGAGGRHRVSVEGFTMVEGNLEARRWVPRLMRMP